MARGGRREGAGRPKGGPSTIRKWVPKPTPQLTRAQKSPEYVQKRADIARARALLVNYNLTQHDLDRMIIEQEGVCKICQKMPRKFFVDHDHTTGLVRGLLCVSCNSALGLFHDSEDRLQAAISYLRLATLKAARIEVA